MEKAKPLGGLGRGCLYEFEQSKRIQRNPLAEPIALFNGPGAAWLGQMPDPGQPCKTAFRRGMAAP